MRLVDWENVTCQNRAHFFAVAQVMQKILIDHARKKKAGKRGLRVSSPLDQEKLFDKPERAAELR